jgi:hypothetical protein
MVFNTCILLWLFGSQEMAEFLVYMCKFSPLLSKLLDLLVFQLPQTYPPKKEKKNPSCQKLAFRQKQWLPII